MSMTKRYYWDEILANQLPDDEQPVPEDQYDEQSTRHAYYDDCRADAQGKPRLDERKR